MEEAAALGIAGSAWHSALSDPHHGAATQGSRAGASERDGSEVVVHADLCSAMSQRR